MKPNTQDVNTGLNNGRKPMRSILTQIHVLSFLCALPACANDIGLMDCMTGVKHSGNGAVGLKRLFASRPGLDERIAALRNSDA